MHNVYPVKYYKDEGFVEYKVEIVDEDLNAIIEEYLHEHADFEFDEIEIENKRPMNIWLHAKCRKFVEADTEEESAIDEAEAKITGAYDGNP